MVDFSCLKCDFSRRVTKKCLKFKKKTSFCTTKPNVIYSQAYWIYFSDAYEMKFVLKMEKYELNVREKWRVYLTN